MDEVRGATQPPAALVDQDSDAVTDVLDTPEAGSRMIRGSAQRLIVYLISVALGIGAVALMTRQLGVIGIGRYVTVTSLIAIVVGGGRLGLNGIVYREYSVQHGARRQRVLQHLLGMRAVYTVAGIGLAVGFGALAGYTSAMVIGTAVFGFSALLIALAGNVSAAFFGSMQLGLVALLDLLLYGTLMITVVALVLAKAGLLAFLAAQIPAAAAILVVSSVRARGRVPLIPAFDRAEWSELSRRMAPYLGAALLSVLCLRLNPILMSLLASARQTG